MPRATIDFGIDLGTRYAVIAVVNDGDVEVIRSNYGDTRTPCAVWLDRKHRIHVGQLAKQQLEADSLNGFGEFKLEMGKQKEYRFARNDRVMLPEELSAEILKSLKGDVRQRMGEEIQAAVITVPAAFELPQCEATKRAAQLAGFTFSPLVQEPVAAALAYGFQGTSEKVSWLVYDLGSGTFDAALLNVRDGQIHCINHGGDNHLGGKFIDWAIVEELLIPAVTKEYHLTDFRRGNPKWQPAIATLKHWAEEAKIRVFRAESWNIAIDFLCCDDRGERVFFEYTLHRRDVERLSELLITRSINICKSVLAKKGLSVGDIEKLMLVGGSTLMPYLRERLTDRSKGLGIPLDFSQDPMTVVARGAALFSGTQRIPYNRQRHSGQHALQTVYSSIGAEKGSPSAFLIRLCDVMGTRQETAPNQLLHTHGGKAAEATLIHSIGVALANNEVVTLIEKGSPLPARGQIVRRTVIEVRRGQTDALIRIPIVEGENKRADRNRLIGSLEILATKIRRDIPAGSEVEIVVNIDASRLVRIRFYMPSLDEEYEAVLTLVKQTVNPDDLRKEIEQEMKRLDKLREKATTVGDPEAQQVLQQLEQENLLHDVEAYAAAAHADPDAGDKAEECLLELKITLDRLEDALEWPVLLAEAQKQSRMTMEIIQENGSSADRQRMATLEWETHQAIESRDPDLLRRKVEEVSGLRIRVLTETEGRKQFVDSLRELYGDGRELGG